MNCDHLFVDTKPVWSFSRLCLAVVSPAILWLVRAAVEERVWDEWYRYRNRVFSRKVDEQVLNIQSHLKEEGRTNPTQSYPASGYIIFISSRYCQLLVGWQGVIREEDIWIDIVASLRWSVVPLIPLLTGSQMMQHVCNEVQFLVHLCNLQRQREGLSSSSTWENCNKSCDANEILKWPFP